MPAVQLYHVEKLGQFALMGDSQTGLNSQRIQWEVTAINSANLESKTSSAHNVETVRRKEKHFRLGYVALVQYKLVHGRRRCSLKQWRQCPHG